MSGDVEQVVEIRDPEIDADTIMRQIREKIRQRRAQAEAQGLDYEALVEGLGISPEAARFDRHLYYNLRRISVSYDKLGVGLSLTASHVPIISPLMQRARAVLHHLVIYYTNMLAGQQARFNEHVMRVLTGLVKALEQGPSPDEVEALRRDVQALRAQLEQLEAARANR